MSGEFISEPFRRHDVDALAEFIREEYPESEIAYEKFLLWEYFENPSGRAVVTLARDAQMDIASHYAVIPVKVLVNGKLMQGSLSLNTLTSEKYRGRGLFKKTASATFSRCAEEGILFTFGIPNKNSFCGFVKSLHFSHPGNLLFLLKPLKPLNIIRSAFLKGDEKKGKEVQPTFDQTALNQKSVFFFNADTDMELYTRFWNQRKVRSTIVADRTAEYINWRYFKNPLRKYHALKYMEGDEMKSFIVIRALKVFGMNTAIIMDFFSEGDRYGTAILDAVGVEMKRNNLDCITAVSAGRHGEYVNLKKSGFMNIPSFLLPQQLPFIVKVHEPFAGSEFLSDLNNWHFSFGDYDIF